MMRPPRLRAVAGDAIMRVASALIDLAARVDPAPMLPGAEERMWARVKDTIEVECDERTGTDA